MATLSEILLLTDLSTGESASGAFANWGESSDANWAFLEDTIGEVTSKAVTSLDVTLTAAEERSLLIKATGVLTGNRAILTSGRKGFWFCRNDTTGAFTLTFKPTAGTGIVVPQGGSAILVSDGTNILEISPTPTPTPPRELGEIVDYAGATAPANWLLCFGQAISRTTYAALFAVTSTTYGVGNGSTTFNLPDLRGRVVAGQDDMGGVSANRLTGATGGVNGDTLGGTGGEETHALTSAGLNHTHSGGHSHSVTVSGTTSNGSVNHEHGYLSGGGGPTIDTSASGSLHTHTFSDTTTSSTNGIGATVTEASSAHNNVQPTIILNKIIYAGV